MRHHFARQRRKPHRLDRIDRIDRAPAVREPEDVDEARTRLDVDDAEMVEQLQRYRYRFPPDAVIALELGAARLSAAAYLQFSIFEVSFACVPVLRGREMSRADLFERTMKGWARLNPQQRERFFQAGLRAALRLERPEFREWLRRRVSEPPLAESVDPVNFAISKTDIALLMRSARQAPPKKSPQRNLESQKC